MVPPGNTRGTTSDFPARNRTATIRSTAEIAEACPARYPDRMTTTEKRGFRLPWGGDGHRPDDEPETGPGAAAAAVLSPATDLAPAIGTSGTSVRAGSMLRRGQVEDLGRGPFDLVPADEQDVTGASASLVDVVEPAPKAAPEPDSDPEPVARETAEEPAPDEPATPGGNAAAWPEMDRRGSARHLASDAPPPARPAVVVDGSPRKVNPLVAGLVKAMRDAARAARDETTARMRNDAAARAEEIRLEATAAGSALKKHADEDVAGIREWSRTEAARIKQETDTRIAARKERLLKDAQAHAAATERLNADLKTTIAAFESEMDRFFDRLLQEEDPARLATLAERLPEPPTFARLGDVATPAKAPRAPRSTAHRKPTEHRDRTAARLAPDAAAAAEAEAILGLDEESAHDTVDEAAPERPVGAMDDEPMAVGEPEAAIEPEAATEPSDGDTNGHVAPVADATDDADAMAAWAEALASIRAGSNGFGPDDEPTTGLMALGDAAASAAAVQPADPAETASDEPDLGAFDATPGSLLGVLAGANRINSPDDLSPEERIALLGFDEPAPGDEPAPMTVEPVVVPPTESITRVVVAGLASVAEISAFKSALVGVAGVNSVSVSTGHDGDFVFSVVHATTTDLRAAVTGFARFAPQLTADEDSVLTYAVGEPTA